MSPRALLVVVLVAGVMREPVAIAEPAVGEPAGEPAAVAPVTATKPTKPTKATKAAKARRAKAKAKAAKAAKAKRAKAAKAKAAKAKRARAAKARKRAKSRGRKTASKRTATTVSRTPSKGSLARTENMPRGYVWPPNAQMLAAEAACEQQLADASIAWKRAARDGRIVSPMTVANPDGSMTLGGITYRSAWRKAPHKLDCQLALALHTFGGELHAIGVRDVKFGSIYRWTNVRVHGKNRNMLSRHALGIAMDIVSFTDDQGREVNVERDYPKQDPLLLGVEAAVNSSRTFRILLTPRNDPRSHKDHFHLEVAVDYTSDHVTAATP